MMKPSPKMRYLERAEWIRELSAGKLHLAITSPGYGSYGGRHGAWGMKQRLLGCHIFYGIVKGGIEAHWGSGHARLEAGSAFWLSPNVRHDFALEPMDRSMTLFHFRLEATDERGRPCRLTNDALVLQDADRLRLIFEEILALEHFVLPFEREQKQGLFLLLCAVFLTPAEERTAGRQLTNAQRYALEKLVSETNARFFSPVELANELDLSPEYFARIFVNTYGSKPRTWIAQKRIRQAAATLLESSASVAEIAQRFGYADRGFFSRQFRKFMGCGPRAYRQTQ